jgi:hypothetical protein
MLQRCNPQIVEKAYLQARSWRKTARVLNDLYNVNLSHTTWRDYAVGKHDIVDTETRVRLILPPRACPSCGHKHATHKYVRQKKIREYGYQVDKAKSFLEAIDLRDAPR